MKHQATDARKYAGGSNVVEANASVIARPINAGVAPPSYRGDVAPQLENRDVTLSAAPRASTIIDLTSAWQM